MSEPTIETREELFMSAAAGESVTLPDPETTEELYLAKAAGESVTLPSTTDSRIDVFLAALAEGGGGGGGVEVDWTKLRGLIVEFSHMSAEDQEALILEIYDRNSWAPVTEWFAASGASTTKPAATYSEAMIVSCAWLLASYMTAVTEYMSKDAQLAYANIVLNSETLAQLFTSLSADILTQNWWTTVLTSAETLQFSVIGAMALTAWSKYAPDPDTDTED